MSTMPIMLLPSLTHTHTHTHTLLLPCGAQNMPSDIVLSDDGSAWVGPSGDEIKSGVDVRLKIISAGVQASHLVRTGFMAGRVVALLLLLLLSASAVLSLLVVVRFPRLPGGHWEH